MHWGGVFQHVAEESPGDEAWKSAFSTTWLKSGEQVGSGSQPQGAAVPPDPPEERWVGARHLYFKNTFHVESEAQEGVEQLLWVFYHMPGPGAPDLRSLISTNSLPAASLPFLGQIIAGKSHFFPKIVCSLFCVLDHSLSF